MKVIIILSTGHMFKYDDEQLITYDENGWTNQYVKGELLTSDGKHIKMMYGFSWNKNHLVACDVF